MSFSLVAIDPFIRAGLTRVLTHFWSEINPTVAALHGEAIRIGDLLLWHGPTGRQVIGALESLHESQHRIETAVVGIHSAQVAMQGTLGVVQSLSLATLGITSLSGAFMAYRFQALNKRIAEVRKQIQDVEGKIDAEHKAHLKASLQFLREYDDSGSNNDKLRRALDEARQAANIYGQIAADEATGTMIRLPILNCRGRLYIVALLTEIRCLMSGDESKRATERIDEEQFCLRTVAKACFDQTLKKDPERYLTASFQPHGVSLDVLTNIYQQARQLGVIDQPQVDDANQMFEHLRVRGRTWQGMLRGLTRAGLANDVESIRYLLACLEETSKIEGLRLLIGDVQKRGGSLSELICRLKEWKDKQMAQEKDGGAPAVYAYAF